MEREVFRREIDRQARGRAGEEAAARLLEEAGYRVVARNVRYPRGELDLVVERDDLIAFVEVRMRATADWGGPGVTVNGLKQRRVVNAARRFLLEQRVREKAIRFDVVTVLGHGSDARLEHIPNAFDAGE